MRTGHLMVYASSDFFYEKTINEARRMYSRHMEKMHQELKELTENGHVDDNDYKKFNFFSNNKFFILLLNIF